MPRFELGEQFFQARARGIVVTAIAESWLFATQHAVQFGGVFVEVGCSGVNGRRRGNKGSRGVGVACAAACVDGFGFSFHAITTSLPLPARSFFSVLQDDP